MYKSVAESGFAERKGGAKQKWENL